MKITSRDNNKLKNARKTRVGKFEDLVFVEGLRLAEECLRSNFAIIEAFYTDHFLKSERANAVIAEFLKRNLEAFEVSRDLFDSLADTKNSQGIILISKRPETGKFTAEIRTDKAGSNLPLFVLLHEINNPANLGAILRTAEAANVNGVILTRNSTNAFAPKALRASMGAAFRMPIWDNATFSEALDWAKENDLCSICADIKAELTYSQFDWKKPVLLVFGSEAHGLGAIELSQIDGQVSIPLDNNVESLNLAVSCGIILFEAKRQNTS